MSKRRCDLPKMARLQLVMGIVEILGKDSGVTTSDVWRKMVEKGVNVSMRTIYRDLIELSIYSPISDEIRNGDCYWLWTGCSLDWSPDAFENLWRRFLIDKLSPGEAS